MNELMRRAAPGVALAGLALSTVWFFEPALHASESVDLAAPSASGGTDSTGSGSTDSGAAGAGSTDTGSTDSGSTDSGAAADGSSATGSDDSATGQGTTSDGTTSDGATSGTTSSDCSSGTTTETGDAVSTQWGPVQVQMVFAADGSVCSVQAIAYPSNDHHSQRINATAIPYLDAQATEAGVSFDAVSGATYTSEAYRQSMQSILDRR